MTRNPENCNHQGVEWRRVAVLATTGVEEVVVDGPLVTARKPRDTLAFCREMMQAFSTARSPHAVARGDPSGSNLLAAAHADAISSVSGG